MVGSVAQRTRQPRILRILRATFLTLLGKREGDYLGIIALLAFDSGMLGSFPNIGFSVESLVLVPVAITNELLGNLANFFHPSSTAGFVCSKRWISVFCVKLSEQAPAASVT